MVNESLKIQYNPSNHDIAQIKEFLIEEDRDYKEGFYCNWKLIEDAFVNKRVFSFHLENECIGFVDWREDSFAVDFDHFVIRRDYRLKGIGRIFVDRLLIYWRHREKVAVKLYCEPKIAAKFWRRLGFIQFPASDTWKKLSFYINLVPVQKVIEESDSANRVELWDVEPHEIKNRKPRWVWSVDTETCDLAILQPCPSKWNLRIIRDGKIVAEGSVGRVSDAGEQNYFYPFLYIGRG